MTFGLLFLVVAFIVSIGFYQNTGGKSGNDVGKVALSVSATADFEQFVPPDTLNIPADKTGEMIRYGRALFIRTALLIGPKGGIANYTGNYGNCQNCHLQGGTKPLGNALVYSHLRYPQYRGREGKVLTLADRVNNCIERPLLGKPLPQNGREMTAFLAYLKWISAGRTSPGDETTAGLKDLPLMERAANPKTGKSIYLQKCAHCHGQNGEGTMAKNGKEYQYPVLWGPHAYARGSSMNRVSKMAAYVKYNMPYLQTGGGAVLTDEEAWDVAAYINDIDQNPRPHFKGDVDFPNVKEKPFDFPYGPYGDGFSEMQHRFGPYKPIIEARALAKKKLAEARPHRSN